MSELDTLITEFSANFSLTEEQVNKKLSASKGWDGKYREIMLLGKNLGLFGPELKLSDALVSGCESSVWLHHIWQRDKLVLAVSSDSKIVRGLLAIILVQFNGKTKDEVLATDVETYFQTLGLAQHLSPSRANGIAAIVEKIKAL